MSEGMYTKALRSFGLGICMAAVTFGGPVLAAGGNPFSFGKPDFELTGRVYDDDTKEPIERAYVVAIYYVDIIGPAALTTRCKRTKGMYTGKDGTFHFPVEKLDGNSPGMVMAIKSGFFSLWPVSAEPEAWRKQTKAAYTGRDLPLKKQDPQNPSWQLGHGDVYCTGAESRSDVQASVEYMTIELAEYLRLGAGKQGIEAKREMIEHLRTLPEQRKAQ